MRRTNTLSLGHGLFVLTTVGVAMAGDVPVNPIGVVDKVLFDDADEIGLGWMREDIVWTYYENADGVFTPGGYAADLTNMESRGIRMSPVIRTGFGWATHQAGDSWNPTDDPDSYLTETSRAPNDLSATFDATHAFSESYYDFVFHVVSTFGDRIDRVTIENEVNARNFWEDSIDEYRRLLVTARKAVRDANPSVMVFDSGMGSGSWGAAIAESRFDAGEWTWDVARDFLQDYYVRDVYVRPALPEIYSISTQAQLEAFFGDAIVVDNNARVNAVLDNLYSADLGEMLIDGLNFKYTGAPWQIDALVTWMEDRISSVPNQTMPDVLVNNEASSWCLDVADFDGEICQRSLTPTEERALASEMVRKIVRGFAVGVDESLWFPFSNCLTSGSCAVANTPAPRYGLIDYDGNRTDSFGAFARLSRFVGPRRSLSSVGTVGTNVDQHVFREGVTSRDDVYILWWDNGGHGAGSETVSFEVPLGTVTTRHYTADGDSMEVVAAGDLVSVTVTEDPSYVYFDDGVTPIEWPLDPVVGPAPPAVTLTEPAPNPAPGWTRVRFGLPRAATNVRVGIFDVRGREIAALVESDLGAGTYYVRWDGRTSAGEPVAGGVYLVRLRTNDTDQVRKLVLSR